MEILYPYTEIKQGSKLPSEFDIVDHLDGFDENFDNIWLNQLTNYTVYWHQIPEPLLKEKYPNLEFSLKLQRKWCLDGFHNYKVHPELNFQHFVSTFLGGPHVGRKLLSCALHKFGYFDSATCSKNFILDSDTIYGHIQDYDENTALYNKFFINNNSEEFLKTIYTFGQVDNKYNHCNNLYDLEKQLTSSFIHIVGETMPTSYVPYVSEKFLQPIVTRGLWLSYAQPGWHAHVEQYYGFKLYKTLFDYNFDNIKNPLHRLIELLTMIGKYKNLTKLEWHDLYLLESETIEYNIDHYFSKEYIKVLEQYNTRR